MIHIDAFVSLGLFGLVQDPRFGAKPEHKRTCAHVRNFPGYHCAKVLPGSQPRLRPKTRFSKAVGRMRPPGSSHILPRGPFREDERGGTKTGELGFSMEKQPGRLFPKKVVLTIRVVSMKRC